MHAWLKVLAVSSRPMKSQKLSTIFLFNEPAKINSALFWPRSLMNPLMGDPYGFDPEFMEVIVAVHGTEIVTVASKNYKEAVGRMKYYAELGVKFRVCAMAAEDYGLWLFKISLNDKIISMS